MQRSNSIFLSALLLVLGVFVSPNFAQSPKETTGQFESSGPWSLQLELTEAERAALEPPGPQGFGGPAPPTARAGQPKRESVANLLGMQFPWVEGVLKYAAAGKQGDSKIRLRYDGDFTYMLSAAGAKRPLFVSLLDENRIQGSRSFRLHTLQFDPTLLRERVSTFVFASLKVPVPRVTHAEVNFKVGSSQPQLLGLYTAVEAVDEEFLNRNGISSTALLLQSNGLNSITYVGDEWTAYAPLFRPKRIPTKDEQERIIAFAKFVSTSTDEDFQTRIERFVNLDALLRYIAANAITSNLTGFSRIGTNDYVGLDAATGRFHFIATELETALSGAVLSGTPDQLANLSVLHPYSGECKLLERVLKVEKYKSDYLKIIRDATHGVFSSESIRVMLDEMEKSTFDARDRETKTAAERTRARAAVFGGGVGGGPALPTPMDVQTFVKKRNESIAKQLDSSEQGFVPSPPNFPGVGGSGPSRRQSAQRPITAEQFRENVRVPSDFEATLYAKSPQVNYPVAISADPSGAIYVASDEQGSLGTDKNGGKILKCIDKDGDGVMDSVTTFCRVDHVRGVVNRGGTVWVCHPPFLSVFHDDNGDGVADRQQQLVSGLTTELVNTRGGDHTTNGVRMGIDGWLYIGDGDYGVPEAKGLDGSTVVLRGGGILRVRPDGTELELFCSGLRNPFDIAIDPRLNMFTRDNTNDGGGWDTRVSQLFQSAEYGYPRLFANFSDEIMPALGAFGGGGGTGSLYIQDESWPDNFNESLFTSDWGRSEVFHHPLKSKGPTFELTQKPFAVIPRATGMDIDVAGNLYVASWWNGEASVYVGPEVGFVARIRPKSTNTRKLPSLSDASLSELVELLRSPQAVVRFHVQGELLRRGSESGTTSELSRVVKDPRFPIDGRIVALFAIKQIEGQKSNELLMQLTSDADLRESAIRALTDRKSQLAGVDANKVALFLRDPSARVRAQTLISLGRLGDSTIAAQIVPLINIAEQSMPDPAKPNANAVIPHLAVQTLLKLNAVEACLRSLDTEHWRGGLRVLRNMHAASVVDGLVARLGNERDMDRRTAILTTLVRLYQQESPYDGSWWGIRPDTTGPNYDPKTWEKSPQIKSILLTAIHQSDAEIATKLRSELKRHQVNILSDVKAEASEQDIAKPIVIATVDPANARQVGNMTLEEVIDKTSPRKGSVDSGAAIFKAISCNACHTSAAGQKPIGPHLADIGKRYKTHELIESIIKPSAKIAQGYETQQFLLDDGTVLNGFIISENGRQISLRDSQGKTHVIARDEIDQRSHQKTSAMPEGLAGSLEVENLADLIAYLQSL